MNHTESTPSVPGVPGIYQAINNVMRQVTAVRKDGFNNHSRYSFRGIDDVLNRVGPALRDHGVIIVPTILEAPRLDERATKAEKLSLYWTIRVRYTWICVADGSQIECEVIGEAADTGDKGSSKAQSVAFRTAMIQVLAIPTDEPDPDEETHEACVSQTQADEMLAEADRLYDRAGTPKGAAEFRGWVKANWDLIRAAPTITTADGVRGQLEAYVRHLIRNIGTE
jgi:hypothetical protein